MDSGVLRNPALVISECQRGVVDPELSMLPGIADHVAQRGVIGRIAGLATAFRAAGLPVVHCLIEHRHDLAGMKRNSLLGALVVKHRRMIAGTPDVEVPAPIAPLPGDIVSSRAVGLTAFYGTNLDAMLRLQGVETIVAVGVSTNVALPGLALEAVNRGYDVVVPEDCTAGNTAQTHEFMISNMLSVLARVCSAEDVRGRLPGPG